VAMLRSPRDFLWRFKFEELKNLVIAARYEIIGEILQTRGSPHPATLFGKGKVLEIKKIIEETDADVVITYNVLKSIQKVNLEMEFQRQVLDRYDLTLQIFAENATDTVSKLQIELASIQKEIPYVRIVTSLIHFRDRPFIRAGGEYGWSPKVAELRRRMKRLKEEIQKYRENKIRQIMERKEKGFTISCIVGYYNAGKTTLFNALTGENKPVSDRPFTTLSSKYSRFMGLRNILLVDTIGFVIDLDPRIIKSFEINVDDMRYSDMLILTLDASDPPEWFNIKSESVINLLRDIGALVHNKPLIIALNKIDRLSDKVDLETRRNSLENILDKLEVNKDLVEIVPISAKKSIGLDKLVLSINKMYKKIR